MRTGAGARACALALMAGVAVACASGGSDDASGDLGDASEAPDVTASSSSGSSSGVASSSSSGSSGSSSGGIDSGAVDSGLKDASKDAPVVDASDPACAKSPDTCTASATMLGTVAGDESGPTESASGYTSEWLRLDETENDGSPIGHAMTFTAILTSPPGMNYDLYAYLGASGQVGNIECSALAGQSTEPAGEQDTVTFSWGETTGGLSNGSTDTATVMIEVRYVSGICSSSQNWSLAAHGD